MWSGLLAFFRYADERADGWRVLHVRSRTHGEPFARLADTMRTRVLGFVTVLLAHAARTAEGARSLTGHEITGLAHALVGAAESLATRAADDPALTPAASARTLMDFAWTGLGGAGGGRAVGRGRVRLSGGPGAPPPGVRRHVTGAARPGEREKAEAPSPPPGGDRAS